MASYSYTAINRNGQKSSGMMDAPRQAEVVSRLAREGLFVTKVLTAEEAKGQLGGKRKKSLLDILFPGVFR
jgi:type II secretory pathway component PulF